MAIPSSASSATNTMLSINEKKTTSIDLHRLLRKYISSTYSEQEAKSVNDDLEIINKMRSEIERNFTSTTGDSATSRCDLLQSYYKALCVVESRFPISPDKDHVNTITFTWFDAFKPKSKASQKNIHLEKAALLFNLGAVYSQIGLTHDRSSIEGCKLASHAFIAAAGAFAFLRDNEAIKASIGNSTTVDVSVECAGMLERLMLAQAQECVFENTIAKGSTPGVCSKIAMQVGLYYEEALGALNVAPLNQHFNREWISHVQLKASLFYAEACSRYCLELHAKEEIGEEIARLNIGITLLMEGKKKSSRGASPQVLDAINKLEVYLNKKLEIAMKENDRVYLSRIPSSSSLSPLAAFSLVKSMPMHEFLDPSNEKLFARLVPKHITNALSRYTKMVDDVIQTQEERMRQASELARMKLKEIGTHKFTLALEGNFTLPQGLSKDIEEVQTSGGLAGLLAELEQLKDLKRVNQELLMQTEELMNTEAREDSKFRNQFGTKWTRPQSITLTKNLQDSVSRLAGNLKQAAEGDNKIEHLMKDHSVLMSILDGRPIEAAFPNLARPLLSLDANGKAIVGTLKKSLTQLETLLAQRPNFEDMLKDMKEKDDILPKVTTHTGSYEDLFTEEITKYNVLCEEISHNIKAQEELLLQIQAQNDKFTVIFNLEDYQASREKCYRQIEEAILKFREIKGNVTDGLKFYVTLQDAITNVKQQCSDFTMTRNIECREMVQQIKKQADNPWWKVLKR